MVDPVDFTLTSFISVILFIVGFIVGERQAKNTTTNIGHKISETILEALKLNASGDLPYTEYNRKTATYRIQYPDSTTNSSSMSR